MNITATLFVVQVIAGHELDLTESNGMLSPEAVFSRYAEGLAIFPNC